jgi:hypothetical protein
VLQKLHLFKKFSEFISVSFNLDFVHSVFMQKLSEVNICHFHFLLPGLSLLAGKGRALKQYQKLNGVNPPFKNLPGRPGQTPSRSAQLSLI